MRKMFWIASAATMMALGFFAATMISLAFSPTATAATRLIDPAGNPSPYQRWVRQDRLPSYNGTVILAVVDQTQLRTACAVTNDITGCEFDTGTPVILLADDIWGTPDLPRSAFYHELGHVIGGRVLTDQNRRRLLRTWNLRTPLSAWSDGETAWAAGRSAFPPVERFAEEYRVGAEGHSLGSTVHGNTTVSGDPFVPTAMAHEPASTHQKVVELIRAWLRAH